jgi:hypothetical protein
MAAKQGAARGQRYCPDGSSTAVCRGGNLGEFVMRVSADVSLRLGYDVEISTRDELDEPNSSVMLGASF